MNIKTAIKLLAGGIVLASPVKAQAQPIITKQPTNQSVSLGASVKFQVSAATTSPPILYQWRQAKTNLPSANGSTLTITDVQRSDAGDYDVVVTDGSGSVTSERAHLEVDPNFSKITADPLVTDTGSWGSCAWADYDEDGFIDLFITSSANSIGLQRNALYHNSGNGTFKRVTAGSLVSEARDWRGCAWGDYDNDGYVDLFATSVDGAGFPSQGILYHNNGNGSFTKASSRVLGSPMAGGFSEGCVWGDYDNDGWLDLFVARYGPDWLLHNNGNGTLTRITSSAVFPPDNLESYTAMWGHYDNDGWPDLFVPVKADNRTSQNNLLYRNKGDGSFTKVLTGSVVTDNEHSVACAWADYDNDGQLDLFVSNGFGVLAANSLYRNNGNGTFTKQTSESAGSIVADIADFGPCTWGDYDNDGWLDMFIVTVNGGASLLYHNNGDGTFSRVSSGSPVNDAGLNSSAAWGDYDNDGFLDLLVTRGVHEDATNLLYRNNGNANSWIKLKLVGTLSNSSAIGAKVRVKATLGNRTFWQMREINAGNGFTASPLEAHFGLGDATNIDTVRVEWPSGTVQIMTNVPAQQFLTVTEPTALKALAILPNGSFQFSLTGGIGLRYDLETSSDLGSWTPWTSLTSTNRTIMLTDTNVTASSKRFYRAVKR